MRIENGWPIYYSTANAGGATLLKTDEVYSGGSAGLGLSGIGQFIGMWDAGIPRLDHVEFDGRVTDKDGLSSQITHATRVAGTLIATGVNSTSKGMAYQASVDNYNWSNDISEMSGAAADGTNPLLNSVHPYQINVGWSYGNFSTKGEGWYWYGDQNDDESFFFGHYDETTREWDNVAYLAQNYLIVVYAGNQRGEIYEAGTPEEEIFIFYDLNNNGEADWESVTTIRTVEPDFEIPGPDGGVDGYKSISGFNLGKNVFTVGSVNQDKNMSTNSSWGPTDDGRIKPDVLAKGVSVYSSAAGSTTSYSTSSGTSFSAPMIAGSAALLMEHQENLHPGSLLLSSTLRGLIIHTAEELGNPGPDYQHGWGLMNTREAADVMSANAGNGLHIFELTLAEGEEKYINIRAKGGEPLRSTLAWTDPPVDESEIITYGTLNDSTPMLVNDLDMRIFNSNATVFQPFILDPANPANAATAGDNFRDNVEMVHIQTPNAGEIYTIKISHKDNLEGGSQNFSLIITGNEADTFVLQVDEGNGEGWRFLSTPVATTLQEFLEPVWTQGPLNSNLPSESYSPSVLLYDGADYVMPADLDTPLQAGTGVAVYLYNDDNLDGSANWPKNLSSAGLESISPFQINTSNGLNPGNDVFSLLGNPFNSAVTFGNFIKEEIGEVVYVYDHACNTPEPLDEDGGASGGCFRAWNGIGAGSLEGGRIAPFQGFFVFATGSNPSITIPEVAKTGIETQFYKEKESSPVIQLAARLNGNLPAETWFSFSESGSDERNRFDAPYLFPVDYLPFLSLYSEMSGESFSIKNLPMEFDKDLQIPVHIEGWQTGADKGQPAFNPASGYAELSWPVIRNIPSNWTLSLKDNQTDRVIDMRTEQSYQFDLVPSPEKSTESLPYSMNISTAEIDSETMSRFTMMIYPYQTDEPFITELPEQLSLSQNYPNSFNPSTQIRYELPQESNVTLDVFSIEGQRVATLVNTVQPAGMHSVSFDASSLASGVYLYRLTTGNTMLSRKMILIK